MQSFDLAAGLGYSKLPARLARVERALEVAVADAEPAVKQAALRTIRAGGKRLRPALVLAVAASQGTPADHRIIAAATAVELVHIGSLVHDDIIDQAGTRWNQPTVVSQEGLHRAILVGDYLFAKAGRVAAGIDAAAAAVIADTITTLCNGESRELAGRHVLDRTVADFLQTIEDKTAVLLATACQLGAQVSECSPVAAQAWSAFGRAFGMSFQIVDDVLDLIGMPERLGKPIGSDVGAGMYTLPLLLALQGDQAARVRAVLALSSPSLPALVELLSGSGALARTIDSVRGYNQAAAQALRPLHQDQLAGFPAMYAQWALRHLTAPAYRGLADRLV